jgi:hypothetical protein
MRLTISNIKTRLITISSGIIMLVLNNCVTPFEPERRDIEKQLVVSGAITDGPGPHFISVNYTPPYSDIKQKSYLYPNNARVFLQDDAGYEEELTATTYGTYKTANDTKGIPGRTYHVIIVLEDGTRYESRPELMAPVPAIDTLFAEFKPLPSTDVPGKFSVYLETTDAPETNNYYWWNWQHYETLPYCKIEALPGGGRLAYPCCNPCWRITFCDGCFSLTSDYLSNGKRLRRQHITDVPYDSKDPYYLMVKQQSVSESAFKFWSAVYDQLNNTGGVFDKSPATIQGNIFNVSDPTEQVLGYFMANSVVQRYFYIDRNVDVVLVRRPFNPYSIAETCVNCENQVGRTNVMPPGWIN